MKVLGKARTNQRRAACPSRSITLESATFRSANTFLILVSRSSREPWSPEFTIMTTTLPSNSAAILASEGSAPTHGPHQVAQKSTSTGLGRADRRSHSPPPTLGSASAGAGSPAFSAATSRSSAAPGSRTISAASPSTFCLPMLSKAKVLSVGFSLGRLDFDCTFHCSAAPASASGAPRLIPIEVSISLVSGSKNNFSSWLASSDCRTSTLHACPSISSSSTRSGITSGICGMSCMHTSSGAFSPRASASSGKGNDRNALKIA